jgi:hypothetical protein
VPGVSFLGGPDMTGISTTFDLDRETALLDHIADWRGAIDKEIWHALLGGDYDLRHLVAEVEAFKKVCRCLIRGRA